MQIGRNGKFSITLTGKDLSRGLRNSKRNPRNNNTLIGLEGAVGRDEILSALDALSRIDSSVITDSFPYPQIFVFTKAILVCGSTKIYEYDGSLTLVATVTAGSTWKALDFFDFIYMSNGKVVVTRDTASGNYAESSDFPVASAMCNFNGQVLIGSPGVEV